MSCRVGATSLSIPGTPLDECTAQYVRCHASAVSIDETSELLAAHGLTRSDAFRLNDHVQRLSDCAVDHGLLMSCG